MSQPLSRASFGILAPLGGLLVLVFAIGFAVFGLHSTAWQMLLPVGIVLMLIQGVIRIGGGNDGPD